MFKSKLSKVIVSLLRRVLGVTRSGAKRLMRAMLRSLMAMGRRARLPVAGFVLPTVTMVLLVVILLTVAITLRSFDRANIARNVRVNQQVLAAATPALDRAKAKIEYMLREDPQRPTATPSDAEMYRIMSSYDTKQDFYTFAGEQRLVLRADLDKRGGANPADNPKGSLFSAPNVENEALNTAWRYAVDTNNDGKFDTFSIYGIYFRTPKDPSRPRKELHARTPPMRTGTINPACAQGEGTVASLVGDSGWERITGRLQKSFFVYTVNVPITPAEATTLGNGYQAFSGNPSISALEYQQDQSRIPLSNNAVVYEDDLEISPGPSFNLNGRILTNSNFLVTVLNQTNTVQLFEVSSKESCFYDQENSRILVGGNVVNGWSGDTSSINPVLVHLFKSRDDGDQPDKDKNLTINKAKDQSVDENSLQVLYNNNAYSQRLAALVNAQLDNAPATDPSSVQQAMLPPKNQSRSQALEDYFKERLRKVPFAEEPLGSKVAGGPYIQDSSDRLRPINDWSLPTTGTATKGSVGGPTKLTIRPEQLEAQNPENLGITESEKFLGDRVIVGNNLPALRWNAANSNFTADEQEVDGTTKWKDDGIRTRTPQVTKLADVGATERGNGVGEKPDPANPFRDGFWEKSASEKPRTPLDGVGGLRVITSAGVYDRTNSFLPPPTWIDSAGLRKTGPAKTGAAGDTYDDPETPGAVVEQYPVVWPDSMPMSPLGLGSQVWNNTTVGGSWTRWDPDWSNATDISIDLPLPETSPDFVNEKLNPANRQYAKGDLRMRASAVYQYANGFDPVAQAAAGTLPTQIPLACVSSYYDPSNASTARNISVGPLPDLPDVSGEGALAPDKKIRQAGRGAQQAFIGSNNGITYGPPTRPQPGVFSPPNAAGLIAGGDPVLEAQANMVFPDGRFANGPLRTALQVAPKERTLAQQAAIDSTNCALQILDGSIGAPKPALIPHGAIQEVAFVNGREVKAIDRDDPRTMVNEAFTLSSPLATAPPGAQLTGNYNQPLEEREPLEIRATQLDLDQLRGSSAPTTANGPSPEYLLPNSGIIYASRDDALPDRSSRSTDPLTDKRVSPTDNLLDPTRKPNGILLINGQQLFRGGTSPANAGGNLNAIVQEKGLTLVSNLPAYIKGTFNVHGNIPPAPAGAPTPAFKEVEEFTDLVSNPTWGNFYSRKTLDPNFACRAGDPRLPKCTVGDFWRPATVLADAVTLLSQNYRFGFRNEGDFDLRNNAGAAAVLPRRQQGFFNNNFVTNGLSSGAFLTDGNLAPVNNTQPVLTDATYAAPVTPGTLPLWSSYFNNFVTPVQRRGPFPAYVMEICTKLPISECTDADWFVDPINSITAAAAGSSYLSPVTNTATPFQAGSTVDPPVAALQRFPRRVAFQRDFPSNPTHLLAPADPQPLGIDAAGNITAGAGAIRGNNTLWFAAIDNTGKVAYDDTNLPYQLKKGLVPAGTNDGSRVPVPTLAVPVLPAVTVPLPPPVIVPATYTYQGSQPLLVPVPQLQGVTPITGGSPYDPKGTGGVQDTAWGIQPEINGTKFNLIVGAGDTPSRVLNAATGDFNGGLQNLPRFLELWSNSTKPTPISNDIKGSFIQQNRSAFSTAPYLPILPDTFVPANAADKLPSLFTLSPDPVTAPTALSASQELLIKYNIQGFRIPYFTPPTRNWGFDVGLLSQPPDLFTQRFTTPSTKTQPAEYFREVGRDDPWVKTLMCGTVAPDQANANQKATSLADKCTP